jgi:hypothetical protein
VRAAQRGPLQPQAKSRPRSGKIRSPSYVQRIVAMCFGFADVDLKTRPTQMMLKIAVLACVLAVAQHVLADGPSSVVVLNDSNFEHLTQASTGNERTGLPPPALPHQRLFVWGGRQYHWSLVR